MAADKLAAGVAAGVAAGGISSVGAGLAIATCFCVG